MGSPPSVSSEERAPLNSESVDYVGFLQLYATAQNPNVKYWYDVKSILVRRRKKAKNAESTSSSKDDGQPDKTKKSVRFATNSKNGSPWVLIKRIDKIEDMKLVDELWWTEEEMCLRNESDNNMANVVETHYEGILQDAFQSTGSGKVRPGAKKIKDVALDMERMKKIGAARGLESLVSPEIQKNVKKHRRAVMGAQQILRDHKRDLSDDKSVEMIAQASLKYSQPSRLVSKKMAQFDNEAGQYGFKSAGPRKPTTSQ
mmetsp:Transcript_11464/g.25559  ORF Transcript_11464/g.25559 Transcript_11464/m.25559 type:complete len:258 (+) Transcript_11464:188-961(+)|eukprot:CAMPEP_0168749100 /NCGR_PEP_ID=MMETSP0724-20121128/16531_1 /TAXON_ID=265536 /ORGANISM="Amphiprora sp., Strain CCMP467" /LENGTH=257 /DNA_ID=CAMNT_0008796977 /DNA_START=152 /DNA_END=925 /DNA_ORIENTATION=-